MNISKITIAFDLDGVLIDLVHMIDKYILNIHGIDVPNMVKGGHDYSALTGLSSTELWKIFRMVYKEIDSTPIFPGATELLTKLYENTHEPPMILTARPHDAASDTYAIVERMMGKTPFQLILKHPNAYKSQYLKGYKVYVEDRRKTALELFKIGLIVPLVKTDYNVIDNINEYPGIYYISGVHELIPNIDSFIEGS